jgi:hypothetical protein
MNNTMNKYVGLTFLMIMLFGTYAENVTTKSGCVTNPPDFSKLSYEQLSQAVDEEERKTICSEYITNLLVQLQDAGLSNDKKVLIIYLLGELRPRDTNSIEVLIRYIDLKAPKIELKTRPPRWGRYPARDALVKIGKPAVNIVLEHLPSESDELRRKLMCDILIITDGKNGEHFDEAEGKRVLQRQINNKLAQESDPAKRANLEAALKELDK